MGIREALDKVLARSDLTSDEASGALAEIVDGEVDGALIGAFLIALRMKGETAAEVAGLARTMRENAVPVTPTSSGLIDVCGTGGDGAHTVNISTATAFVVAGAGLPVAKHGNRAISSGSGSADVLEALGIPVDIGAEHIARCIDEAGIGFMFAPALHPAMAKVMPTRRTLSVRTVFNMLGPLTNPARPSFQLIGVAAPEMAEVIAGAIAQLGVTRAVVVHGAGGTDELTCAGECIMILVEDGKLDRRTLCADDADLDTNPLDALRGGTPEQNAQALRDVLDGKPGPYADCVLFNAGAALMAGGRAHDIRDGVVQARDVIARGDASTALDRLVAASNAG
jgi:anthranilate phosphoribosyltransferase